MADEEHGLQTLLLRIQKIEFLGRLVELVSAWPVFGLWVQ